MIDKNRMELDERRIAGLSTTEHDLAWVGADFVDAIHLVMEPGEMAYVPWFEVISGGEVRQRINGKYVAIVTYAEESEVGDED